MSKVIRILNDLTINKIAAGEVVEGPYSVIKELIENAIDAGASNIVVEIKEGGQKYIRVSDNGVGIDDEDVEIAFMRHATSKIEVVEDLNSVLTLGFRGEALASIAAVSQAQIITKPKEQLHGVSLDIVGGDIVNRQEIGAPNGTTIIVKNLFFNIPARLKFMKSSQAEATKIGEIISRLALSQPNIAFKYINNSNIMFTTPGNNNLEQTILSILDKELVKNLLPTKIKTNQIEIDGFISQPTYVRGNRNYEIVFVNGRYIKSKLISKAIEDAYKEKLPINKFPVCILNINIDPNLIDVNVHPTKTEIKFHEEQIVYSLIHNTVTSCLRKNVTIPSLVMKKNNEGKNLWLDKTFYHNNFKENKSTYNTHNNNESNSLQIAMKEPNENKIDTKQNENIKLSIDHKEEFSPQVSETFEESETTQESFLSNLLKDYKIIGQLFNTYIIVEKELSMFLIDQHAAHERLVYNKLSQQFKENSITAQRLLSPEILHLSNEDYSFITQFLDKFKNLGFEIESFGMNTMIIREVPLVMGKPKNYDFLFEVIDELKNDNYNEEYFTETIIRKSCREAIKASDKLSLSEMNELIKDLCKIEPPLTCPHGRPILLSLTKYEIEKNFKRIQ
ncbi:DNA mismatch repair protein MutL [Anaerovirgula multivorans]|uniref:DNA mismatch repair protein MutL n=1 Tax=Anaerovirgula multivorans TaxID=312168 RepID=A0A238ZYW4_9FIRM|nr:DNA mismatch repair endonuclease MutL [Anaerovirgula multivorans]SNR88058.1 DNA mismatch repair protein MutL [Anaerovirgula multivorans]